MLTTDNCWRGEEEKDRQEKTMSVQDLSNHRGQETSV